MRKRLHEPHRLLVDPDRRERVDVEGPNLHVANPAPLQRDGRFLPRAGDLLRANEAVELVLDLEEVGIELAVLAIDDDADLLVGRMCAFGRLVQGVDVGGRRVVGDPELSLRIVLVADVAHPQRGGERLVESAPAQLGEIVRRGAEKRPADRRRGSEQQRHEPSSAMEVAYEREVSAGGERTDRFGVAAFHRSKCGPQRPGQGEVEVHAGNDLHHPAVSMAQPAPVHVLHGAHVGAAVVCDGDGAIARDHARHARRPQHLASYRRAGELVQVAEAARRLANAPVRGGHELEERFGKIGRDVGVSEGGPELLGVGPLRNVAGAVDAQALFLDSDPPAREKGWAECLDEAAQAPFHDSGQPVISMGGDGLRPEGRGFCAILMAIALVGGGFAPPERKSNRR